MAVTGREGGERGLRGGERRGFHVGRSDEGAVCYRRIEKLPLGLILKKLLETFVMFPEPFCG